LRERERAKRKDQNAREFFPFSQESEKKKGQTFGTFFYILFIQSVSLILAHVLLSVQIYTRARRTLQKRRDFETTKRERDGALSVPRWWLFFILVVVFFFTTTSEKNEEE